MKQITIFVQDDIFACLLLAKMILSRAGFNVIISNDIHKAKDTIIQTKPDLIFCDIMDPGINGIEFCKMIKSDPLTRDIPFCFLTAVSKEKFGDQAIESGCNGYLEKPYKVEELIRTAKMLTNW